MSINKGATAAPLRLFVALEPSAPVVAALGALQSALEPQRPPVSWVAARNMHLTLHFLGNTEAALLPRIGAALRERLAAQRPHTLRLGAPGAFPHTRRPAVLWAGVSGDLGPLSSLQTAVVAALEPLGFPHEQRPFHPHLTLGSVQRRATPAERARIGELVQALQAPPPLEWPVTHAVLVQSDLRREGPVYTIRDTIPLNQT